MADRPTTWAEVIRRGMDARFGDVHTAIPGKVVRVNLDGQNTKSVDVQPLIQQAHLDEEDQRVVETLPVICSVPVAFPSAGNYRITFPIDTSTTGIIIFSEASLDAWLAKDGTVDPVNDWRFNLADAMFYPGLRSFKNPLRSAPTDRMTVGDDSGLQIHIDGSKIKIGSNVDLELDKAVCEGALKTWISDAQTAFAGHAHATPSGNTTSVIGTLPSAPANLGSNSVMIKK
jgi:hypothetical protein